MRKKICLLFLIYCFVSVFSFSLKGKVLDKELKPVIDATITLNNQFNYYTDSNGDFVIEDVHRNTDINIKKTGYNEYNASFFINKDSFFSAMLEKSIIDEKKSYDYVNYPSLYGISGGIEVINSQTVLPDKYNAGFDIFRIMFKVSGNSTYRTTSNLRFSYGIGNNTEAGLSFFITEDNNFNVVNEDNVFSLKKSFRLYNKDIAVALSTREGSDVIYLIYEDMLDSNIKFIGNINYNISLEKEKFDTALVWKDSERFEICAENVQDYNNNSSQRSVLLRYTIEEYTTELYYLDNNINNYEIIGAGFSLNF